MKKSDVFKKIGGFYRLGSTYYYQDNKNYTTAKNRQQSNLCTKEELLLLKEYMNKNYGHLKLYFFWNEKEVL
jgi:hypothetical protein